jgi:autotransporter-associated beta strand protein
LVFASGVGTFSIAGLDGAGNQALTDQGGSPVTLNMGFTPQANTDTFTGVLSGTGGVTKIGTGTQIFTNLNTYTGATTVRSGTLTSASIGSFGTVSVASSSTSSSTITLASATLPSGFGVGSTIFGQTVQSINGTTVVLSGNANIALGSNAAVIYNSPSGFSTFGSGSVALQGGTLNIAPNSSLTPSFNDQYGIVSGASGQNTIVLNSSDPVISSIAVGQSVSGYGYPSGDVVTGVATTGTITTITLSQTNTGNPYAITFSDPAIPAAVSENLASGVGSVLSYSGGSQIDLNKGTNPSLAVTIGNSAATSSTLVRSNRGTLVIATSGADLGSGENLYVNGPAPVVTNGMVDASLVGYSTTNPNSTGTLNFLTYGANGFAVTSNYTNHSTAFAATTGEISNITNGAEITGGNPYAIAANGGFTIAGNTTVTVGNGVNPAGIILNNGGSIEPYNYQSGAVLNFGTSEGIIYSTEYDANIGVQITGSNGLTFSGAGNNGLYSNGTGGSIELDNTSNSFTGPITVNAGATLIEGAGTFNNGVLGNPNNVITLNGGGITAIPYYNNNPFVGLGRSLVLGSGGGALYGSGGFAGDFSGVGNLSVQTNIFSYTPLVNNSVDVLSGHNTFTGTLNLIQGIAGVSSQQNLGASTSSLLFDNGVLLVNGTSLNNFGSHTVIYGAPANNVNLPTAFDIQDAANTFTLGSQNTSPYGIAKFGLGNLVLGAPMVDGSEYAMYGGTLVVSEANGAYFTVSIPEPANGASQPAGVTGTVLNFSGGNIDIIGSATGTTTESVGDIQLGYSPTGNGSGSPLGGGTLIADNGGGTLNLSVGNIRGEAYTGYGYNNGNPVQIMNGTTLQIEAAGSGTTTITSTGAPDSTGIYGGRVVYTANGDTNWVTGSLNLAGTYTLSGYTNYTDFDPVTQTLDSTTNASFDAATTGYYGDGAAGNNTVNTLKVIADSATNTTFDMEGTTLTLASGGLLFTGSNNFTISDGSLTSSLMATNQNGGGANDFIVQQYSSTNTLTISASITNNSSSSVSLTKAGPGELILTGANTYTGHTFLDGGILSLASTNFGATTEFDFNGGTLQVSGLPAWTATLPGSKTQVGTAGASFDVQDGGVLTLPQLTNESNGYFGGGTPDGGLTINSSDESGGTVVIGGNNSQFTGGINILGGVLRLTSNTSLYESVPVNYVTFGTSAIEDLQLNGNSAYVAGLVSSSPNAVVEDGNGKNSNAQIGVVNGDNETYAGTLVNTLTTGNGTLGLLKAGAGVLSLTNVGSTYTGVTEIDGGALNVALLDDIGLPSSIGEGNVANNAASLVLGGDLTQADGFLNGVLQYTGSTAQATDRLFTIGDAGNSVTGNGGVGGNNGAIDASGTGSGTVDFDNTGAIAFGSEGTHNLTLTGNNTGANTFAPLLGDSTYNSTVYSTSLVKSGVGAWSVTNANTYTGGTTVTGGTLYANNVSGSATGYGNVAVTAGTLSGNGTMNTKGTSALTVSPGGTLAPGVNSVAGSGFAAPGGQGIVPYLGTPGTIANGKLTLDTTGFTGGGNQYATFNGAGGAAGAASSTPLVALHSANLTFTLGAGTNTVTNAVTGILENNTGSEFVVGGTAPNDFTFTGTSTIAINDLVGVGLTLYQDYILIQGNGLTNYDTGTGSSLVVSQTFTPGLGYAITGGLTLEGINTPGNFFSSYYGGSQLYLNGDNIDIDVVPEPSTWAMMLGGLALLLVQMRRQRKSRANW